MPRAAHSPRPRVLCGLERLAQAKLPQLRGRRVGLLMHPASVTSSLRSARAILHELYRSKLTALFGPQHGFAGEKQDNMVESGHTVDADYGIPIFSLYSETRSPTGKMIEPVDALLANLQDIGPRVSNFGCGKVLTFIHKCLHFATSWPREPLENAW